MVIRSAIMVIKMGYNSRHFCCTSEVSQGSHLGPLVFKILCLSYCMLMILNSSKK